MQVELLEILHQLVLLKEIMVEMDLVQQHLMEQVVEVVELLL
jgi:hypothetical protein